MPRTGDTYSRPSGTVAVQGQPIKPAVHEMEMNDLADALSRSARLTRVQDVAGDLATTGSNSAYAIASKSGYTALTTGLTVTARVHVASADNATLNVDGLGAVPVRKVNAAGDLAITALDLLAGGTYTFKYDLAANGGSGAWVIAPGSVVPAANLTSPDMLCQLTVQSTTSLKLSPLNGGTLIINGIAQTVPGAGVLLSAPVVAASTLYYVYAFMAGSVMTLEVSTTGYTADTFGRRNKTGATTSRLVGMVVTTASGLFVDAPSQRLCRSCGGDRGVQMDAGTIAQFTINTTSPTTFAALSYLAWAGETIALFANGDSSNDVVAYSNTLRIQENATTVSATTVALPSGGNYRAMQTAMASLQAGADGPRTAALQVNAQVTGSYTATFWDYKFFGFTNGGKN